MCTSTNLTGHEVNDYVSLQWPQRTQTRDNWRVNSRLNQLNYPLGFMLFESWSSDL
jgi:hypothetical protein